MSHEYLSTAPFDLEDLHVFHLLAQAGHFTRAAQRGGLTQSSLTRRIQSMEEKLGVALFDRTTRRVALTEAGKFLQQASGRLVGDVDAILKRLSEEFAGGRREVRVGVSRSISLAHLPGLLASGLRHQPDVITRVVHESSTSLLEEVEKGTLDLAVLCPPTRLPISLRETHRFKDNFELIGPRDLTFPASKPGSAGYKKWLATQRWLIISEGTQTALRLRKWLKSQEMEIEAFMELDSFDIIIHLVALGMGLSFVPQRALAAFARKGAIQRLPLRPRFTRDLVVVARKQGKLPAHLEKFVECVLF